MADDGGLEKLLGEDVPESAVLAVQRDLEKELTSTPSPVSISQDPNTPATTSTFQILPVQNGQTDQGAKPLFRLVAGATAGRKTPNPRPPTPVQSLPLIIKRSSPLPAQQTWTRPQTAPRTQPQMISRASTPTVVNQNRMVGSPVMSVASRPPSAPLSTFTISPSGATIVTLPQNSQLQQQLNQQARPLTKIMPTPMTTSVNRPVGSNHVILLNSSSGPIQQNGLGSWTRAPAPQQQPRPQMAITDENAVHKCTNFLKTLIKLSKQQAGEVTTLVQRCVESVVLGSMSPGEFTTEIQKALKSAAQPHLLPFLERALPPLRKAIQEGRVVIEGVNFTSASPSNRPQGGSLHLPTVPAPTSAPPHPQDPDHQSSPTSSSSGPSPVRQHPNMVNHLYHPPVRSGFPPSPLSISSPSAVKTLLNSSPIFQPQHGGQMQRKYVQQSVATPENTKYKQEPADDELNDVAAMGGVNLAEETKHILATSGALLQTHTRSALQEGADVSEAPRFVSLASLRRRVLERGAGLGVRDAHGDAVTLVALALQRRLRDWLQRLAIVAEHRIEAIRTNPFYRQISDSKSQLRFLDEVDRLEYQRKEDREKEMLIKLSKSKSGRIEDEDAERLKAKAKELQKAEQEVVRNRDANMAAQLALQTSARKRPYPEEVLPGDQGAPMDQGDPFAQPLVPPVGPYQPSLRTQTSHVRIKRVAIKDLHLVLSEDKTVRHSLSEYRSFLTSSSKSS